MGYVVLGLVAGCLSGFIGIGGGVLLIPVLVYFFKMSQHMAQGTTLAAMVAPIGILAAITYYNKEYVNIPVAVLICIGFVIGGLVGAKFAVLSDGAILKKVFGIVMLVVAFQMIFSK
ncbi:MAG: sulfite exporter TauE/SafE family protein [Endomicrobiales bacterium]|nr:sulfite exporter TauE/SafE family protein [Endomicrobiales bacterium]